MVCFGELDLGGARFSVNPSIKKRGGGGGGGYMAASYELWIGLTFAMNLGS